MILRKNISLNEEYLKKLEPLMQKHNGNLSAVIREVIDLADAAFQDPDSVKRLISGLKKEQNLTSATLFWSLKNLAGRLPGEELVHNLIGEDVLTVSSLEKRLNELAGEIYWEASVKISSDDDRLPKIITFIINGRNPDLSRFLAAIIAIFAAKKHNLGIAKIRNVNNAFEMEMKRGEKEWAHKSILESFGTMDFAFSEIYTKPEFWNAIINLHAQMDYNMATIPRQFFDEIMGGKPSLKTAACIERVSGKPMNQMPLEELLQKVKLYEYMGIIEKMDIAKDSLIVHHGLTEPEAVKKLAVMFVELLKLNGHIYTSEVNQNLIILKRLPEVGRVFIKMLEDLKNKEISLEEFHTHLLKMLELLKNTPFDGEFLKSSGSQFGKLMTQNYEKDRKIDNWTPNTFVKYLQEMNATLKQDSKWEVISENVIHGRINSCPMVKSDDNISSANCTFIKGIFDGSIVHAFGEKPERIHEDKSNFCEVYVAI